MNKDQEKYYNRPSKKSSAKIVVFTIIAMIIFLIIALIVNEPVV